MKMMIQCLMTRMKILTMTQMKMLKSKCSKGWTDKKQYLESLDYQVDQEAT